MIPLTGKEANFAVLRKPGSILCAPAAKLYRPRNPEALPFYKLVRDHFDEFERVYDERFEPKYGYWRPVIRTAIDKFLKCGDLKEGFARVPCPDGGKEFFIAFSFRSRPAGLPILRSEAGAVAGYAAGGGGICAGSAPAIGGVENVETGTFMKQRRMSWAALIKKVYEVDPLRCPECGSTIP